MIRINVSMFAYVTTSVILLLFCRDANACSCSPSHPQELFCNSQFVIRAIVTSPATIIKHTDERSEWATKQQSLSIIRYFRGEKAIVSLLSNKNIKNLVDVNITTPPSESLCGVSLEYTKSYLIFGNIIGGNELAINLCNYIAEWEYLTNPVKRGIYGDYDCRCKINTRYEIKENEIEENNDEAKSVKKEMLDEMLQIPTLKSSSLEESINKSSKKNTSSKEKKENTKATKTTTSNTCYWDIYPDEPVDECAVRFMTCRKLVNAMVVDGETETCVWIEGEEYQDCKAAQYKQP